MKMKLFTNAKIYTVEGEGWEQRPAEAMAVGDDGRIVAVGNEATVRAAAEAAQTDYGNDSAAEFSHAASAPAPSTAEFNRATNAAAEALSIETIDMHGRVILPGFIDAHVHAPGSALTELFEIYLYDTRVLDSTLKTIQDFVLQHPEKDAYFGTGFYISIFDGIKATPKQLLDEICADKPMILQSSDGHSMWLNTAALKKLSITENTPAPIGGNIQRADDGTPNGIMSDAFQLITLRAAYTPAQETEAMRLYQQKMLAWGFTAAMHISPHFADPHALEALVREGAWKMRVNLCALADPECSTEQTLGEAKEWERLFAGTDVKVTTVKFFMDGVVEGRTAYLKEPYAEPYTESYTEPCTDPYPCAKEKRHGWRGEPLWPVDKLAAQFADISAAGYQIHVHSIGDAATRDTLAALRLSRESRQARSCATERQESRDVLTHLQLVDPPEQDEMARLGIIASFQPFWHFKEPHWYEEIDKQFLGEERALAAYPAASLLKKGVRLTFSGDYPASPANDPFFAIDTAVTRNLAEGKPFGVADIVSPDDPVWLRNAQERISVKDAIEAYTINGAFQLFREHEIGSLTPGKYADFIVLDRDILEIDPTEIDRVNVLETWVGGEHCPV